MEEMTDVSGIARKTLDIPYGTESPNQRLDIFLPEGEGGPVPALVYIHGGGFMFGDKRDFHLREYLTALERGWAVVAVEYRLSGEALFPAAVLDARKAVRWLKVNGREMGVDPDRLVSIGGSAGGNLAAMLGMNIPGGEFPGEEPGGDEPEPTVAAAVDQFGPVYFKSMDRQAEENGISFVNHDQADSPESRYIGTAVGEADDEFCAKAGPLYWAGERMAPLLVQHGTMDKLVPFGQSVELTDGLKKKGLGGRVVFTPIEGAGHDDPAFSTPENLKTVFDFIESVITVK